MNDHGTMDPGNRSSAEIEREVETAREGVATTLGALRDRAAPGPLIEQALDYARTSGGTEMMRNLGVAMRDNPVPLLMIGAGMGWLMLAGTREGNGHTQANGHANGHAGAVRTVPMHDHGYGRDNGLVGTAHDKGNGHDRVGELAEGVRDSVAGAVARIGDTADAALRATTDAAHGVADQVGAAADDLGHAARDQAQHFADTARQGMGWILREQPLVLGAIGVAVGAALGALLPGTRAEDRLMGEARDTLLERAEDAARLGYDRVRDAAGKHADAARDAAGDVAAKASEGLGIEAGEARRGGDAIADAAARAREAVGNVAHGLVEEARGSPPPR